MIAIISAISPVGGVSRGEMADSPEAVAWELLLIVAKAEGVNLSAESSPEWSHEKILGAYQECLAAVKGEARPTRTPLRIVE